MVSDLNATSHSVSSSGSWSVKAEWDVENVGDGKATGSFVTVLKVSTNGGGFSEVQRYTTSNLDQGQKRHCTRTSSYSGVQSVRYEVRVDDTHQIQERNEGNNVSYSETLRK